jgi:enamine deaminase RidA (YjgF/YER057c/UK114 family)
MKLDVRAIESVDALELYVCGTPREEVDDPAEARRMFKAVDDAVRRHDARTCRWRVFVPDGRLRQYEAAYEAVRNPGEPAPVDWLSAGGPGAIGGIQVYALRGPEDWKPLSRCGELLGWTFGQDGRRWAVTGDVHVNAAGDGPHQARRAFEAGEELLGQAGMSLKSVARTWFFLDHILDWYGEFNKTRNSLFVDRGILRRGKDGDSEVPASTGMGVRPATASRVALELFAVDGPAGCIKRLAAAGKQRSAYEYGSAFARAAEAQTPAGRTVFVSGTAAIDESGATIHVGDIRAQIACTIENIIAVLRQTDATSDHVVQAIAYCKTPEVVAAFREKWAGGIDWPWVIVIGDVCREDLLFEAEVTACVPASEMATA